MAQACNKERLIADESRESAQKLKNECEEELQSVMPEMVAALRALDSLDKKDIQELKSFLNPPVLVETVLQALCLLMGRKQTWEEGKKLLNDTTLLQQLRDFDKDHIPNKLLCQIQKFTAMESFTPEKVNQVSKAATSLCMWIRAVERYAVVRKKRKTEGKRREKKTEEAKRKRKRGRRRRREEREGGKEGRRKEGRREERTLQKRLEYIDRVYIHLILHACV